METCCCAFCCLCRVSVSPTRTATNIPTKKLHPVLFCPWKHLMNTARQPSWKITQCRPIRCAKTTAMTAPVQALRLAKHQKNRWHCGSPIILPTWTFMLRLYLKAYQSHPIAPKHRISASAINRSIQSFADFNAQSFVSQ